MISIAFLVIGIALLGYVGFEYGDMYASQKRLEHAWKAQNLASANRGAQPAVEVDSRLTRLAIPKINLDAVVIEGTAYRQLAIAPGHMKQTAVPGERGNAVISAHRDTFFRHLGDLRDGDAVLVERAGKIFRFRVTGKKIVPPDDLAVLKPTQDAQLTLLTCYPTYYIGPAPERLAVFSKLVDVEPASSAALAVSAAGH